MCKLSRNIVPNVYNSLQSSFLSLAWPWPSRSLSKGNQWECWDPGLGPNVVRLPVHMPPQHTPDVPRNPQCPLMQPIPLLAPEYLHFLSVPNTLLTPLHPVTPPNSPQHSLTPTPPRSPQYPLMPPIPLLAPEYLHSLPAPIHP